jgi:hypothetical protein
MYMFILKASYKFITSLNYVIVGIIFTLSRLFLEKAVPGV